MGLTTTSAGAYDVLGDGGIFHQSPTSGRVRSSGTVAVVRTQVSCVEGRTAYVEVKIAWPPNAAGGSTAEGRSDPFTCTGDKQVVWTPVYPADPALPIPTGEVWLNAVMMWLTCDTEVSGVCSAVFDGDYGIVMRGSGG